MNEAANWVQRGLVEEPRWPSGAKNATISDWQHCSLAKDTREKCSTNEPKYPLQSGIVTVAVMVKVHDGIVLATDSATTFKLDDGSAQVYNHADKIFNLHRGLPIAAMTWGLGSVGPASISTVAKDLRRRFMGLEPDYDGWKLDEDSHTVKGVAERLAELFHEGLAEVNEKLVAAGQDELPDSCLGMLVAGYSAGEAQAEAWLLVLDGKADDPPSPTLVAEPNQAGWLAYGQPNALYRLFYGYDQDLLTGLQGLLPAHLPVEKLLQDQMRSPIFEAMPFPDAIALARYFVEVVEGYAHFLPGPDIVGGKIEVAGINPHERFKWISRKHYYSPELNQGVTQ